MAKLNRIFETQILRELGRSDFSTDQYTSDPEILNFSKNHKDSQKI
jgi:hypothetical protein